MISVGRELVNTCSRSDARQKGVLTDEAGRETVLFQRNSTAAYQAATVGVQGGAVGHLRDGVVEPARLSKDPGDEKSLLVVVPALVGHDPLPVHTLNPLGRVRNKKMDAVVLVGDLSNFVEQAHARAGGDLVKLVVNQREDDVKSNGILVGIAHADDPVSSLGAGVLSAVDLLSPDRRRSGNQSGVDFENLQAVRVLNLDSQVGVNVVRGGFDSHLVLVISDCDFWEVDLGEVKGGEVGIRKIELRDVVGQSEVAGKERGALSRGKESRRLGVEEGRVALGNGCGCLRLGWEVRVENGRREGRLCLGGAGDRR